jgi:hypothetical protein
MYTLWNSPTNPGNAGNHSASPATRRCRPLSWEPIIHRTAMSCVQHFLRSHRGYALSNISGSASASFPPPPRCRFTPPLHPVLSSYNVKLLLQLLCACPSFMMLSSLPIGLIALLSVSPEVLGAPQWGTSPTGQFMPLTRRMQPLRNSSEWADYARNLRDATIAKYSSQRNQKRGMGMGENLYVEPSSLISPKCDTNRCKEWLTRGWTQGLPRTPIPHLSRHTHFFSASTEPWLLVHHLTSSM